MMKYDKPTALARLENFIRSGHPFDYLTALQEHQADLVEHPEKWLPWNYNNPNSSANV